MEFLAKTSVSVKILTGWVVGLLLPESPQASSEADKRKFFEVCHDHLGKRYGFDNIRRTSTWTKQPHTCTIIKSLQSSMTKEKQIPSSCQGHVQSNGFKNPLHKDLSVRLTEFGLTYAYVKTSEKMSACLTNPLKS